MIWRRDFSAIQSARDIELSVEAKRRMTHAQLCRLRNVEAGQYHALFVRHAVAVGVLQIENIWRRRHEHAAAPERDPVHVAQAGGKLRPLVEASITIRILEQRDSPFCRLASPFEG